MSEKFVLAEDTRRAIELCKTQVMQTLRDQFAMAALTGMLVDKYQCDGTIQGYAERAYAFADAMLTARKK